MATDASANTKTSVTPTGDLIPDVGQASQISGTAGSSSQSLAATPSSRTKVISNDHTGTRGFNSVNRPSSSAHETSLANQVANEDEDTSSQNAYSTRSRGKNSTRPNYAEDGEVELDAKVGMSHKYSSKASSSLQGTSKRSQATSHDVSKGDLEEATSTDGNHSGNVSSSEASFPRTTVEHSSEPKKRKYIKTSNGKPGLSHVLPSLKTSIPGTSHFSAVASATPDVTTSKRRKLGHDPRRSSAEIPPVVSAKRRVSSMSQLKGRGVPMPSSLVTFEKCGAILQGGGLVADDGQVYAVNDTVYLVCEPPGDPYYLCRIMELRRANPEDTNSPVKSMLVNWFYRPKDIGRYNSDPRYLFASMQSDESPITSLRGKCCIQHRSEIGDLEEYRKLRDTFWFNQLYDRYIHRPYEVVPCSQVINVPENVKRVLNEHWKYIIVEPARMKELTSAVKLCKKCSAYCAPTDSVDCGVCHNTYHMTCVSPPLVKKPSRGFAWSCGPCSRAQERKLEQRHATLIAPPGAEKQSATIEEEEEEAAGTATEMSDTSKKHDDDDLVPETQTEKSQADMWPYRYLGIHCRVEDVLQLDDRAIYPRASSRLGPRHQAIVPNWPGRPFELVKPLDLRRKYMKGTTIKKDTKLPKEAIAALEADKVERANRPKWVQDEPAGYVTRGEDFADDDPDCTAFPLFIMPDEIKSEGQPVETDQGPDAKPTNMEKVLDRYMAKARAMAQKSGMAVPSTNFLDKSLYLWDQHTVSIKHGGNVNSIMEAALSQLKSELNPKALGDPLLTKEELKKFEDGVSKHGSELRRVRKYVGSRSYGEIVRFYYTWKKTARGREIWGTFDGRRGNKKRTNAESSWTELADDEDDSAFDNGKSSAKKKKFECKFCTTRTSRQWRRAPNVAPGATVLADPKVGAKDKNNHLVVALCHRCAILWRKYAMRWEDPEEIARLVVQQGARAVKRKPDEDLLREVVYASEAAGVPSNAVIASAATAMGVPVTVESVQDSGKKKSKTGPDKEQTPMPHGVEAAPKKKVLAPAPVKVPTPDPVQIPKSARMKNLPCEICHTREQPADPRIVLCRDCRLTVHRQCYGILDTANAAKWLCDTCLNDKNNQVSLSYKCILCPVIEPQVELVEITPTIYTKKKTDRDWDRETLEKVVVSTFAEKYRKDQEDKGKPIHAREPLKKTASNNWMHVACAVWMPEIRFTDADRMESAEGFGTVAAMASRMEPYCKLCKTREGACVACQQCHEHFHIGCADEAGYTFGFDIVPVKGSRKDLVSTVTLGPESGTMTAAIWCKEHTIKTIVHPINELVPETGLTALQTFVRTYKEADLTLTGTVRKAGQLTQINRSIAPSAAQGATSRQSPVIVNTVNGASRSSPSALPPEQNQGSLSNGYSRSHSPECQSCGTAESLEYYTHEERTLCHRCHVRQKMGSLEASSVAIHLDLDDDETSRPSQVPDLFSLTDPAPTPLPVSLPQNPVHQSSLGQAAPVSCQQPANEAQHGISAEVVDHWSQQLSALVVHITNIATGARHRFDGRVIGTLDENPLHLWSRLTTRAANAVGFDVQRQIICTEDQQCLDGHEAMMNALGALLRANKLETEWQIVPRKVDRIEPSLASGQSGRPNGYSAPHAGPHLSLQPGARRTSDATSRIPLLESTTGALPVGPSTTTSSPFFTDPRRLVLGSAYPQTGSTPGVYLSASPPMAVQMLGRESTPREQTGTGVAGARANGASSSPNLKNLVH